MQLGWHECRKPDLACAINTVPLDAGSVSHRQSEYTEFSVCWKKQAVRPEGEPLSLPLLSPVQSLLLNYLQGQTGVGTLCIWEGMSWTWDRKFCNLHSNRICPSISGVPLHLHFLRSLYGSIHFCDTRVKWSLTIYCSLEKITQTQPK